MTWLSDAALDHLRRIVGTTAGGRYRIIDELGQGGMGTVYLAEDTRLDRSVALKVTHRPVPDPEAAARMLREARVLAGLEHPGIVPVHDVGRLDDGRVFYAMKLIRGTRLDSYLTSVGRGLSERLRIFERICEAVAFAHSQGVVHRDLKPANVMVGPFGEVLVLDWGVAKLLGDGMPASGWTAATATPDAEGAATLPGTVMGTPGYMAPEQASGAVDRIDERTDVYALGALLHFVLAGRPPGKPDDTDARLEALRREAGIARALAAVCAKALARESADRYPSVEELADDVARFQAERAVAAYREGVVERAARLITRYRTPILLVLAYLIMRALLLVFAGA